MSDIAFGPADGDFAGSEIFFAAVLISYFEGEVVGYFLRGGADRVFSDYLINIDGLAQDGAVAAVIVKVFVFSGGEIFLQQIKP